MTQLIAFAHAKGEEISIEVPAWNIPLRPIRVKVDGQQMTAWRGYWESRRRVTTPKGTQVVAEVKWFGLAQRASLTLDGQDVASAYAQPAHRFSYLWYGLALGALFGPLFGAQQYVLEEASLLRSVTLCLIGGGFFGVAMAGHGRFEQWRFERKGRA